ARAIRRTEADQKVVRATVAGTAERQWERETQGARGKAETAAARHQVRSRVVYLTWNQIERDLGLERAIGGTGVGRIPGNGVPTECLALSAGAHARGRAGGAGVRAGDACSTDVAVFAIIRIDHTVAAYRQRNTVPAE